MATTIHMISKQPTCSIEELISKFKKDFAERNCIFASCIERQIEDTVIYMMNLEKYYVRIKGFATLSILITEYKGEQIVDIVGYGVGASMFNMSLRVIDQFVDDAQEFLMKLGFKVLK